MLFWVALGIFVSTYAYIKLGIGKFNAPGSGLMPFLLGILFGLLALYKLVISITSNMENRRNSQKKRKKQNNSEAL